MNLLPVPHIHLSDGYPTGPVLPPIHRTHPGFPPCLPRTGTPAATTRPFPTARSRPTTHRPHPAPVGPHTTTTFPVGRTLPTNQDRRPPGPVPVTGPTSQARRHTAGCGSPHLHDPREHGLPVPGYSPPAITGLPYPEHTTVGLPTTTHLPDCGPPGRPCGGTSPTPTEFPYGLTTACRGAGR